MTWRLGHLVTVGGWTFVIAGLGLCNVLASRDVDISPAVGFAGAPAPATPQKAGVVSSDQNTDANDAAMDRPLFSPNRLPYQPPTAPPLALPVIQPQVAVAPPVVTPPPEIKLQGIRDFSGVTSALVGSGDKVAEWLRVDDVVDGWRIDAIDRDRLRLALNDRRADYYLYGKPPQ